MWMVLNYIEQAVLYLFLCVHLHCAGQCCYYKITLKSLLFIEFHDDVLAIF